MYGSDQKKPICRTTEQLKKVVLIAEKLREMTENEVFEKTGCLSSCNKVQWIVWEAEYYCHLNFYLG